MFVLTRLTYLKHSYVRSCFRGYSPDKEKKDKEKADKEKEVKEKADKEKGKKDKATKRLLGGVRSFRQFRRMLI